MALSLKELISDLNMFLGEMLLSEKLTAAAEEVRSSLLQRLSELEEPPQEAPPLPPGPRPPHLTNEPEEELYDAPEGGVEDEYEQFPAEAPVASALPVKVSPTKPSGPSSVPDSDSEVGPAPALPAEAITASALRSTAAKHGPLYRKERFIFVEQFRRCWAAVGPHYLFLFGSDKDSKATVAHLLHNYEARPAPHLVKDSKKRDLCFELVSPGRKTYQFIARTQKDMHQWVAAINAEAETKLTAATLPTNSTPATMELPVENKRNSSVGKRVRRLPSLPSSDSEGCNEAVAETLIEDDSASSSASGVQYEMMNSDEEIYYNIEDVQPASEPRPPVEPPRVDQGVKQEVEEEDQYDDVLALQDKDSYYDFAPVPPPPAMVSLVPRPEEEDLYDDVMTEREENWGDKQKFTPAKPANVNKFPTPPVQSTKPVQSAQAVKPPVVPTQSTKPPGVPTQSTKPPGVPTQSTKPPGVPTQSTKPPGVPTQSTKPPGVPTQSTKPPVVSTQLAKPQGNVQAAKRPSVPPQSMKPTGSVVPQKLGLSVKCYKPLQGPKLPTVPSQSNKPVTPGKPVKANTFKSSNSGHIKNLIKQMEATMGDKHSPDMAPLGSQKHSQSAADDLYEPVDN